MARLLPASGARVTLGAALATVLVAISPSLASAADGILDTRFSSNGLKSIDGDDSEVKDVAALSDGRLVAVGEFPAGEVALMLQNGNPDTSFDGDGFAEVPLMSTEDVDVQPDDKIVVSGPRDEGPAGGLARLTTAGAMDSSFGGGTRTVDLNPTDDETRLTDVAVAPDGAVVVVGTIDRFGDGVGQREFAIGKFTSTNNSDSSFSGDGVANFDLDPTGTDVQPNSPNAVEVQSDGKILVAGRADVSAVVQDADAPDEAVEEAFVVIRVTTSGLLDNTFASGTGTSYPNVITGTVDCERHRQGVSFTFGKCSKELESAEDIELQEGAGGRKITVGGWTDADPDVDLREGIVLTAQRELDYALVRLNDNGTLDTSFSGDGKQTTAVATNEPGNEGRDEDQVRAISIQPDGKILAAGRAERASQLDDFSLVRYRANGSLDPNFDGAPEGGNGRAFYIVKAPATQLESVNGMALLPNGSILLGGTGGGGSTYGALVVAKTDGVGPETVISSGPAEGSIDEDGSVTFSFFTGFTEPAGFHFECRFSPTQVRFSRCSSPLTKSLPEGAHTFQVRAVDAAGNVDSTPATRSFTVDLPPQTVITSGPAAGSTTGDPTPTFGFATSPVQAGSTFQCRIDGASFTACSGPGDTHTTANLAPGQHTFRVVATDPTGHVDPTPAQRTFTVVADTTAPNAVITAGPAGGSTITDPTPSFDFSTNPLETDPITFACRIDAGPFTTCSGPGNSHTTETLSPGSHTFRVTATDPAGNTDANPAKRTFTVAP